MIEQRIMDLIKIAIQKGQRDGAFAFEGDVSFEIGTSKQESHGDFAVNAALILGSLVKQNPRKIADEIIKRIPKTKEVAKIEAAGPGFINFTIAPLFYLEALEEIFKQGSAFGRQEVGAGKKLQVEFVSANPTGPLHIGHGRGAVYGDVLGNIFDAMGYSVTKEYYVNDTGGQIGTLGRSVYLRLKELEGENIDFPEDCYQGHYIRDIAREIKAKYKAKLGSLNEEGSIDFCGDFAATKILEEIKKDLAETGVVHDMYFFENRLHSDALVETTINRLREKGYVYDQDGAIWFNSTAFGDDKDRVLKKGDGSLTYFAADIAYHKNKYERGFSRVIDVWGADHGGYVARVRAAVEALGYDPNSFNAVLIQLVNLMKGGKLVSMSTRSATYETLEDVRKEVGRDVCRYFFLMRSHNAQLDFDLDLAKKETPENPVFYIQYAHARISSIFRKAAENGYSIPKFEEVDLDQLDLPEEPKLARLLCDYPAVIAECAEELEPHHLAFYLMELARQFQAYYSRGRNDSKYKLISQDRQRTLSKLYFLKNIQTVLQNGLGILGITAPEEMTKEDINV